MSFKVQKEEEGTSLLQFLKGKFSLSGKEIKRAIERGCVQVNTLYERFSSYKVQENDWIQTQLEKSFSSDSILTRLYQDDYFEAFYKPPFYTCKEGEFFLHRLDRETSGVILNSKEEAFIDLFRHREITKVYYALCEGKPRERRGIILSPLVEKSVQKGKKRSYPSLRGKYAETHFRIVQSKKDLHLIRVIPKTGRMHQVRVHLSHTGLPILGDGLYGRENTKKASRVMLHAYRVVFTHPFTQKKIDITAKPPQEFLNHFHENLFS